MALLVKWWCFYAILGVHIQEHARGQLLRLFRGCVLPHEVRARPWERYEQFCIDGRKLERRRRSGRCICKPGYYRDEETRNCFEAERCGQCDSSKHEKFNACLSDCEMICGKRVIQQCNKPCKPGCQCVRGYIRKYKKGPCVPIMSCPPKCPAYMKFVLERERCPRVCNEAREDTCSAANEGPGCVCKKGFVLRAIFGTIRTRTWCIHESMCHFPDEEKKKTANNGGGHGVKGGGGGRGRGNGFHHGRKEGHGPSEDSVPKKHDDDLYLGTKGFPSFGGIGRGKGRTEPFPNFGDEDNRSGRTKTFPDFGDEERKNGRTKGFPSFGGIKNGEGRGSKPSDDWFSGQAKGHDSQQRGDWFKQHDIFSGWKQDRVEDSLSPTKVASKWTPPAKGQSQIASGAKGGPSKKGKGSRRIPGVGFASTDELPDIEEEGWKESPFGDWNTRRGGDMAPSKISDDWLPGIKGSHKGSDAKGGSRRQTKGGGIPGVGFAPPDGLPDVPTFESKGRRGGRNGEGFGSHKVGDELFPGQKQMPGSSWISGEPTRRTSRISFPSFDEVMNEKGYRKEGEGVRPDESRTRPGSNITGHAVRHEGGTKGGANEDSAGIAMGILHAGVNLGKKILGGLGSIASFGGLIEYSLPGLGKGKHSIGDLRDNTRHHDAATSRGQRLFSTEYGSRDISSGAQTKSIWRRRRREVMTETEDLGRKQRVSTGPESPLASLQGGDEPEERSDMQEMVEEKHIRSSYKTPVGRSPAEQQYVCDELNLITIVQGF